MTTIARAMRPWTVCFSCGSALQPDQRWLENDGLLCRECARRRRIELIRHSGATGRGGRNAYRVRLFDESAGVR